MDFKIPLNIFPLIAGHKLWKWHFHLLFPAVLWHVSIAHLQVRPLHAGTHPVIERAVHGLIPVSISRRWLWVRSLGQLTHNCKDN